MKIKTLIYLHDTLGLGRLKRNLKLANALVSAFPEMSIRIVTGSSRADYFDYPNRTNYLNLPPLIKTGDNEYSARHDQDDTESIMRERSDMLLKTVTEYEPDIFIIDHSHLAMIDEFLPALKWNKENNSGCVNIFGMREIIDDPEKVVNQWTGLGVYQIMRDYYDHVLIYGDRDIYNSAELYNFPEDLKTKTDYCGYIVDPYSSLISKKSENARKRITVTIGGGEWYGDVIIKNYINMLARFKQEIDFNTTIITGPGLPDEYWSEFKEKSKNLDIDLHRFVSNTPEILSNSDLVIATAGYNTITDILSFAQKAIIIPRVKFRTEQLIRAKLFNDLGIIKMLTAEEVSPDTLYKAICDLMNNNDTLILKAREDNRIDLNGTEKACSHIARFLTKSKVGIADE